MVAIDNMDTSTSMIEMFLSALPSKKIELQIDVASILGEWAIIRVSHCHSYTYYRCHIIPICYIILVTGKGV